MQLSRIDFWSDAFSAESLEAEVIPLLSTFSSLTSLRLHWPPFCSVLPQSGLQAISDLRNLNQLCIGLKPKEMEWSQPIWKVDHEAIRRHLSTLTRLKGLALLGDTYDTETPDSEFSSSEYYYEETLARREDIGYPDSTLDEIPEEIQRPMLDPESGKPYWKRWHKQKMRVEAEKVHQRLAKVGMALYRTAKNAYPSVW